MDLHKFFGFVQIINESIKILTKNGKVMSSIAALFFVINSLLYCLVIFSFKPLISDLFLKATNLPSAIPGTPDYLSLILGIEKDVGLFLGIQVSYIFLSLVAAITSTSAIILVSSTYYNGKVYSFKQVLVNTIKTWKRPALTYFFIHLMSIGYMVIFILVIMVPKLLFADHPLVSKLIFILLAILAFLVFIRFSVVWLLGIVVSVIEEDCYGIQALGKAGRIVKGKRSDGFVLNLGWNVILLLIIWVSRIHKINPGESSQILMGLILVLFSCLVQLFQSSSYTILYLDCKKNHGEELAEYSKIPTDSPR